MNYFASITVRKDLSMSKSTVRRALNDLKCAGYIRKEQTKRNLISYMDDICPNYMLGFS